eukprot:PhM_4_TR8872/c0_g1_i1/m.10471
MNVSFVLLLLLAATGDLAGTLETHRLVVAARLSNDAGADRLVALTDGELLPLRDTQGERQRHVKHAVLSGHAHDGAVGVLLAVELGEHNVAGHIGRAEEELRAVVLVEGSVAAALLLREHVRLCLELVVHVDGAGGGECHAALAVALGDLLADALDLNADGVAGVTLIEQLVVHLDPGDLDLLLRGVVADELHLVADLDDALLDTSRDNELALLADVVDVLDRQLEGLVVAGRGVRDDLVALVDKVDDGLLVLGVALKGLRGGAFDEGDLIGVELVLGEKVLHLHLDELDNVGGVLDHVTLVDEAHKLRDADLRREQKVLLRLGHRAVVGGDDDDSAVHLRGTRNHVLDEIHMPGAVDVAVVTLRRLVLHVCGVDGDTASALLRGGIDGAVVAALCKALLRHDAGDGSGQSCLAVVNVADRSDRNVWLRALVDGLLGAGVLGTGLLEEDDSTAKHFFCL